jgi:two-component system, NarL family, nitrate/nitrite response regulator NarL
VRPRATGEERRRNRHQGSAECAPPPGGDRVIDIVLGDDHAVFLDALSSVLTSQGCVVTTAATVAETVTAVRVRNPDVCLIDRHFAGDDGIGALPQLAEASPDTKVLVLSADGDGDAIMRAMRSGAAGYVHKTRGVSVLKDTIDRVLRGEVVVEVPSVSTMQPQLARQRDAVRLAAYLTGRERQCLELLVDGCDTAAMVSELGVSAATVRTHVQSLLGKLGVHSRLEAAAFAVQHGLLESDGVEPRTGMAHTAQPALLRNAS